jgi:hypothetical protein
MKTAPHTNGKDGGVPLYCSQCAYTTTRRDLLTRHAKTHEAAAQQCDQCSFASSRLDVLTKHRKTAHEGLRQATNTLTMSLKKRTSISSVSDPGLNPDPGGQYNRWPTK